MQDIITNFKTALKAGKNPYCKNESVMWKPNFEPSFELKNLKFYYSAISCVQAG